MTDFLINKNVGSIHSEAPSNIAISEHKRNITNIKQFSIRVRLIYFFLKRKESAFL